MFGQLELSLFPEVIVIHFEAQQVTWRYDKPKIYSEMGIISYINHHTLVTGCLELRELDELFLFLYREKPSTS